jgi:predicted dehydrogenase
MKIGLLGIDAAIAQVVAAARRLGDEIVLACDVADDSPHARLLDGVPADPSWEAIVDPRVCDAVLVGADGWNDVRAEGVRKLVQAGRTLLVSHPLELSMLWAYEIDMIRKDSGARVIPFLPERLHPFIGRLRRELAAGIAGVGTRGQVETIAMERRMRDRSRDAVLRQLARDADLVRVLVGDPERLSTLGSGNPETAWGTLAVGFTGPAQVPVRWQVVRGDTDSLRIVLSAARGGFTVERPDDAAAWTLALSGAGPTADIPPTAMDDGETMLGVLREACVNLSGRGESGRSDDDAVPPASWADAARAIELAETVPRSLAKGRAIDLHKEEFSELGTFKGTMASLGCAIVLGALLLLMLATLVGGVAKEARWGFGEWIAGLWPIVVLSVLGIFLALQLLPLLIGGDAGSGPGDAPEKPGGNADRPGPRA